MKINQKLHTLHFRWITAVIIGCIVVMNSLPVHAKDTEKYIYNASGGLRIGLVKNNRTIMLVDEPDILKSTLDHGWDDLRNKLESLAYDLSEESGKAYTFAIESNITTSKQAELDVAKDRNILSLKYSVPSNSILVRVKAPWLPWSFSYIASFNVEIVLDVQASGREHLLQIVDAAITMPNFTLEGNGPPSDVVKAMIESLILDLGGSTNEGNGMLLLLLNDLSNQLLALVPQLNTIPEDVIYVDVDVDQHDGTILLCFKTIDSQKCVFPK